MLLWLGSYWMYINSYCSLFNILILFVCLWLFSFVVELFLSQAKHTSFQTRVDGIRAPGPLCKLPNGYKFHLRFRIRCVSTLKVDSCNLAKEKGWEEIQWISVFIRNLFLFQVLPYRLSLCFSSSIASPEGTLSYLK